MPKLPTIHFAKEKSPPWPLGIEIEAKFDDWKYPRRGQIKSLGGTTSYGFFWYDKKEKKETFRQITPGFDWFGVKISQTERWNPYE
jgi:hypothetical protein